ncbi:hypothetical protein AB4Z54_64870 [Streptomyces sp. MCAF7]
MPGTAMPPTRPRPLPLPLRHVPAPPTLLMFPTFPMSRGKTAD